MARTSAQAAAPSRPLPPPRDEGKSKAETSSVALLSAPRRPALLPKRAASGVAARAALAEVDGIRKDLDDLDAKVAGELRIGAMEVFSLRALPRALAELVSNHSAVVPQAFEMHPEAIQRHVADGTLDVGFTIGRSSWRGVPPRRSVRHRPESVAVGPTAVSRAAHRRCRPRAIPVRVPRFFQQEHLPALDEFPDDRYARRVGATIELLQMGVELVLAGKLLGCFPAISIEHLVKSKELAVLSGLRSLPRFELVALTREGVAPKRAASALVELLAKNLR